MTKAERISRERIVRYLTQVSMHDDSMLALHLRDEVPDAWHTLEHDLDVQEPKMKVTLRLDTSVAKFYRAMGTGYQARMNRILALWAHMKIADLLKFEEQIHADLGEWHKRDREAEERGEKPNGF
jgi:uncharacterized protein (DUF4415 family)